MTKLKTHYQIRFWHPERSYGRLSRPFTSDIEATKAAKNECPPGWRWEVYKITPKVVASGVAKEPADA